MAASTDNPGNVPRAIEVGFPIVEINRLAQPERNSFKPIYQMHKWFARRASCVFRAILLGALKPAWKPDGTPVDLMEEFYRNHDDDPETAGKVVLDPFMGGGTTVVEALRLGCRVIGIDLNPVAWFIVKTEIEPVDPAALQRAFERLAARPVAWNGGAPLRESLLGLYRTKVAPDVEADIIYTFWVKHAICTDPTCKREVPLFKDWLVAHKTLSVRYHRDVSCPRCRKRFDWEVEPASLIADTAMMVNSPRGSAGEGRPHQVWTYAPEPEKPKGRGRRNPTLTPVHCPHCDDDVRLQVPWDRKKERKKVSLTVLLCPACEAVWQWRGALPDEAVRCPACGHGYDPRAGNVPANGAFECSCGNRDKIIESIRLLPQDRRLPVRPYAIQAYLEPRDSVRERRAVESLFGEFGEEVAEDAAQCAAQCAPLPDSLLLPKNGKFFKRFSASDRADLQRAEGLWDRNRARLPYPKGRIPIGEKTKSGLLAHHYNHWHDMFAPRQLLALATLLDGVMAEEDEKLREMLLCAFSSTLEANNLFTRARVSRKSAGGQTAAGLFARHDYQLKSTIAENNVFGMERIAGGSFISEFRLMLDGLSYRKECWEFRHVEDGKREPDVRLVCIGKCLELYSAHYGRVLDHEGNPLPLHKALQDIGAIVDQLVTRERPLPPELEDVDALSYAWLRLLMPVRGEVGVDKVNKGLRAMQVNTEDLRKAGLIIRGRAGRGRTYEVKQPLDRLEEARKRLQKAYEQTAQSVLFQDDPAPATAAAPLVDLLHALIALADAGEPVLPWLERFRGRQAALRAGLRFLRDERADWSAAIDRVLAVIEGAPLFNRAGAA